MHFWNIENIQWISFGVLVAIKVFFFHRKHILKHLFFSIYFSFVYTGKIRIILTRGLITAFNTTEIVEASTFVWISFNVFRANSLLERSIKCVCYSEHTRENQRFKQHAFPCHLIFQSIYCFHDIQMIATKAHVLWNIKVSGNYKLLFICPIVYYTEKITLICV